MTLLELFEDHYWDSLSYNKDIVLAHVRSVLKMAWQPMNTAPKDGSRILLFVCTRGSLRRGWPEICWWGEHEHWGPSWLRNEGKDVVGPGVATHWQPLPESPAKEVGSPAMSINEH